MKLLFILELLVDIELQGLHGCLKVGGRLLGMLF